MGTKKQHPELYISEMLFVYYLEIKKKMESINSLPIFLLN
ncbi:hypothetical protein SAMN04488130_101346 [Flavobacterium urumqiense]|uniref:Uncharacterized protein n=1 Tax=Flavobacterium urumqiense TaxID=935224 RepID=A0A1H5SLK3_9FLAO|nr:hypothetical protein SAMN04488130_101346 [Flavobacterium urumqiense]